MEFYANLHLHSTHSDGVFSPTELVTIAKAEGYGAVALTDHDTVSGNAEMKAAATRAGMECLFGAEFSAKGKVRAHIVGLEFDPEQPEMKKYLADLSFKETDQTRVVFGWAVEAGGITGITWDEVCEYNKGITWMCNNHVWEAMKAKGLVDDSQYVEWFDKYWRKQRGQVKSEITFKDGPEVVELIHKAGGIAILAHPMDYSKELKGLPLLLEAGLDGIEVWHADLNDLERAKALRAGVKNNLYLSGGSDHSGILGGFYDGYASMEELSKSAMYIPMHSCGTTKELFDEIKNRKINR